MTKVDMMSVVFIEITINVKDKKKKLSILKLKR